MTNSAQPIPDPAAPGDALARRNASSLPIPQPNAITPDTPLRYIEAPADSRPAVPDSASLNRKGGAVLKGLKDLQQLQKQTILVLESLKSSLDDINQVLRSPEATRGLEKQKNAATLLAKGFVHEAVEQAAGAAQLLPANPEAQLLLALSFAADHQLDPSLAATRKGLALIDRRTHPLAIEAGLLHTLATLGCIAEALERWTAIIESLPLPVLLEHLQLVAACYPRDLPPEEAPADLDILLATRITRGRLVPPAQQTSKRQRLIDTRPTDIPAPALFAGIDATGGGTLRATRRAILLVIAQRLNSLRNPNDIVKFITDCIIPLGNRNERRTSSLGRAAVKRLLRYHADAPTLFRAMTRLNMAGSSTATRQLAKLLDHWRHFGKKAAIERQTLTASLALLITGAAVFACILFPMGAIHGRQLAMPVFPGTGWHLNALYAGPFLIAIGALLGVWRLLAKTSQVHLPDNRPPLGSNELRFLQSPEVRQTLRSLRKKNPLA